MTYIYCVPYFQITNYSRMFLITDKGVTEGYLQIHDIYNNLQLPDCYL